MPVTLPAFCGNNRWTLTNSFSPKSCFVFESVGFTLAPLWEVFSGSMLPAGACLVILFTRRWATISSDHLCVMAAWTVCNKILASRCLCPWCVWRTCSNAWARLLSSLSVQLSSPVAFSFFVTKPRLTCFSNKDSQISARPLDNPGPYGRFPFWQTGGKLAASVHPSSLSETYQQKSAFTLSEVSVPTGQDTKSSSRPLQVYLCPAEEIYRQKSFSFSFLASAS